MTTSTPNLNLTLFDSSGDQAVTFASFRASWGGTATTSNFYKIDTAYGLQNTRLSFLESAIGGIPVSATQVTTNNYSATVSGLTSYTLGLSIILSVDVSSTGTVTLNVNSLGAESLMKVNSSGSLVNLTSGDLRANMKYLFSFDGVRWVWVNAVSAGQINISGTSGDLVTVNSDNTLVSASSSTFLSNAIHNSTSKSTPAVGDELGIADSAASYAAKKITITGLFSIISSYINSLTSKTTPVGADEILVGDSAASYANKKVLLSNLYKALGTGTPTSSTALLGDGTWGTIASGSSFWTLMSGTPTRVSNTTFTVTGDISSLSPIAKGTIIKWTESSVIKVGMVSIPPTYSAPNSTITIIGDTMASIDASSLKYAMIESNKIILAKAGTIGITETDAFPAYYAEEPMRVIGADIYVGTAGTTNSTTCDINKNGTTMFSTKPTLASTVAASPTPFTADSGISLALNDKVTADVDAIQTTASIDAYLKIYLFPTHYLYLA